MDEGDSCIQFTSPVTLAIFGCTLSGKSTWCKKLIEQSNSLFTLPINKILYCYGMYQSMFEELAANNENLQLHPGLPTRSTIDEFTDGSEHNLIILDDLQQELGSCVDMEKLFTQLAHHLKLSVIFMGNNLFQKNFSRTITINVHVIVLFRNARDAQQIKCLGRQLFPLKAEEFVNAYKDCVSKPYGYIVVDLSPSACEQLRLRTNIFQGELPVIYKL